MGTIPGLPPVRSHLPFSVSAISGVKSTCSSKSPSLVAWSSNSWISPTDPMNFLALGSRAISSAVYPGGGLYVDSLVLVLTKAGSSPPGPVGITFQSKIDYIPDCGYGQHRRGELDDDTNSFATTSTGPGGHIRHRASLDDYGRRRVGRSKKSG
jgi:hypothetical protein